MNPPQLTLDQMIKGICQNENRLALAFENARSFLGESPLRHFIETSSKKGTQLWTEFEKWKTDYKQPEATFADYVSWCIGCG